MTISLPIIVFSYPQFFPGLRDWLTPGSDARRIVYEFTCQMGMFRGKLIVE